MEKNTNLIADNINNLTRFWKTVGTPFQSYHENNTFEYCKIENSGWPNKLWFNQDVNQNSAEKAIETLQANPNLVIPYWDIYGTSSNEILETKGLVKKTEQVAMALKLEKPFVLQNTLEFNRIRNSEDAKIWSDLYIPMHLVI